MLINANRSTRLPQTQRWRIGKTSRQSMHISIFRMENKNRLFIAKMFFDINVRIFQIAIRQIEL